MSYTEDQIKKYLEILHNYTKKPVEEVDNSRKAKCWNCQNSECFTIDSGYKICDYCGMVFTMLKIMIDYIFEKRVFIRESITMKKRLIKFLKE